MRAQAKLIRSVGLVLLVLAILSGLCSSSSVVARVPQEWKRYRTNNDGFSVALPVVPAMTTKEYRPERSNRNLHYRIIGAYADGVVYAIHTYEYTIPVPSLEVLINQHLNTYRWDPATARDISLEGFRGKQYQMTNPVGGVVQFYVTEDHFYEFEAVGALQSDPRITQFLSSISFSKSPDGEELIDGAGVPWEPVTTNRPSTDLELVVRGNDVERKVLVVSKPEPSYTDSAREKRIVGTVVLKVIFSSKGSVENVQVMSGLPYGLTEQSIDASKQIKFIPAIKNGHFVSMSMQLEYNFNLY